MRILPCSKHIVMSISDSLSGPEPKCYLQLEACRPT